MSKQQAHGKNGGIGVGIHPDQLPQVAGTVFEDARNRAIAGGFRVLVVQDDQVIEIGPDNERREVMALEPRRESGGRFRRGVATRIRWKSQG